MFQRRVFKIALVALVSISLLALVGLLVMGGLMARSSAFPIWRHGHMIEQPDEGWEMMPRPNRGGRLPILMPALCGMGLLFTGLPLSLLVLGAIFFRRRHWMGAGRSWHDKPGSKERRHGPPHPWFWGREKPSEEEMARMKNWHKERGMPPWWPDWPGPGSDPDEEPPKEEPR